MEKNQIIVKNDYNSISVKTALIIADHINNNPDSLLCLAAGSTPLGVYVELVKMQSEGSVNLSNVYYAGLDEWVGLGKSDRGSCYQVMFDHFYNPAGIPHSRIHMFNGLGGMIDECDKMNKWLAARGNIALTLLGVGMNGHVGFNEPNAQEADGAILTSLDEVTKTVSKKYFGKDLPVTMGFTLSLSVLQKAGKILVLASGSSKAQIIKKAFFDAKTPDIPASLLQDTPGLILLLDKEAANLITQEKF